MDLTPLELNEITNLIDVNVVRKLGLHLGFEHAEIQRYEKANNQNPSHCNGTEDMLVAWHTKGGTRPLLCAALREVGQTRLAVRIEEGEFRLHPVGVPSTMASATPATSSSQVPQVSTANVPTSCNSSIRDTSTETVPTRRLEPEAAIHNVHTHQTNTQPERPRRIAESVRLENILHLLAEDVDHTKVGRLGQALNFRTAQIIRYESTNHISGRITAWGTVTMLNEWKMRTPLSNQKEDLRQALIDAGMLGLADEYLPLESSTSI